jgi:amino acid adenylation domain-containing protein
MSHRGATRFARFPPRWLARLQRLAAAERATPYAAVLAGLVTLFARYAGRDDVVVGVPVTTRDRPELEAVAGPLMDALPLRVDVARAASFRDLLGQVRRGLADVYAHRGVPLERLVEALRPDRALDHTPVFQVMVGWRDAEMGVESLGLPGLAVSPIPFDGGTSKFDLTVLLGGAGELACEVQYATDLFEAGTVERMLDHLHTLLDAAVARPDGPAARLPLVSPAERARLLRAGSQTAAPYPRDASIPALFEARCREAPDAEALVLDDVRLTYRELAGRTAPLAGRLRRLGVGPDLVVGVCLERSVEMVVGLLAILQAGGAYLPLDPTDPPDRLRFLMADAGATLALTRRAHRSRLGAAAAVACVDAEDDPAPVGAGGPRDDTGAGQGDRLAYVMYTSGSTGRPKGVEVRHRAVVRLLFGVDYVRLGRGERILQAAPLGFDASTFEIWGALLHGGTLVLYPECLPTAAGLGRAVERDGVTTLFLTTALFNHVVDELPPGLSRLRQLLFGGEAASVAHVARAAAALPDTRIVNCYGPTEATTFTTCHPVDRGPAAGDGTVPIGRPIGNTRVYLLDADGEPAPVGVPGEIYIGGDGLAAGYRGYPGLTAERFLPDPFGPEAGGRLYRTGDLARWRPDGAIEFIGRLDEQVKLRGHRVEPAEVEAALTAHPDVASAAVAVRQAGPEDLRLVAYVVPRPGAAPTAAELRAHAAASLPRHMVPSAFVSLPALPRTASGKLDRAALAPPGSEIARPGAGEPPRTPAEEVVAGIWADVLRVDAVGRREDFFALGGHSLLAIQVVARLRQAFGHDVPATLLFEAPTVAELTARLGGPTGPGEPAGPPVRPVPRDAPLPLSLVQARTWRYSAATAGLAYTHARAFQLGGAVEVAALEASLTAIVRRHEILRTTYALAAGAPVQTVRPPGAVRVPVVDARGHPDPLAEAHRLARAEAGRPVDLARGPLLRPLLIRLGDAEWWLLLTLHHIAYDADSLDILFRELRVLYGAAVRGQRVSLPEPRLQYADYAAWQRERLRPGGAVRRRQLEYWRRWLSTPPGRLALSGPPRDGASPGAGAGERVVALPGDLDRRIGALARRERATAFMGWLAAFEVVLFHRGRRADFVVGTYGSQRGRAELDDVMGCFVDLVRLRARIDDALSFGQLLGRVRAETLEAYARQEAPLEDVADELPGAPAAVGEVPAIFLHRPARPDDSLGLAGLEVSPLVLPRAHMPWGLTVMVDAAQGVLRAAFDARRHDGDGIGRILADLSAVVERAALDPSLTVAQLAPAGPPPPAS